jgi:hypothetical protein
MRNRNATMHKLDSVESNLNRIILTLNQGDRDACYEVVGLLREQVEQLKMYIESEPMTSDELNQL